MPDTDRIRRNMQKMLEQGATPQDIEQYAQYEGVTPEDLKGGEPNWAMRQLKGAGEAIGSAYEGVKGAVQGQQDPNFSGVSGFSGEGLNIDDLASLNRAKLTSASVDDKSYSDIVKKTLGPRLKNIQQDQHGQEIITYAGDDGKDRTVYLNQPGLDWQDVDRFISGSVPYVAAASGVGGLMKGAPLLLRAAGQGLAAGGVSLGADQLAREAGSEQPVSLGRAGVAALTGAGGEVAVSGLSAIGRSLFKKKYYNPDTGRLTKAGAAEAKRLGLNPREVQSALRQKQVSGGSIPDADDIFRAKNPNEALTAAKTQDEFGIPVTKGQRTANPNQLQLEEEMRRAKFGPGAREIMRDFDDLQQARIQQGAETVKSTIAPKGAASRQEAGQGIADTLAGAQEASKTTEREMWRKIPDMFPGEGAQDRFAPILQKKFNALGFLPDEELTPAASKQIRMLEDYLSGTGLKPPSRLFGEQGARPSIDEMRRRLLGLSQAAQSGQDRVAAKAIYDSFNDWIDDIGGQGLIKTQQADDTLAAAFSGQADQSKPANVNIGPVDDTAAPAPMRPDTGAQAKPQGPANMNVGFDDLENYRFTLGGKEVSDKITRDLALTKFNGRNRYGQTLDDIEKAAQKNIMRVKSQPEPTPDQAEQLFTTVEKMKARQTQNLAEAEEFLAKVQQVKSGSIEPLGAEAIAQRLVKAREFTKEQRGLFNPKGRTDAAGKLLQKLANEGETPERIVQSLFGSTPNSVPKAGTVGALRRLKTIFKQNDPSAWDQVKTAYWLNLTRGKNGELLSPKIMRGNIDKAFEQQKSVIDVMFMPSEQQMIRRYRDAVNAVTFDPPNPSGTSYGSSTNLEAARKGRRDNVLNYLLRRMGTRETFRGNTMKGSIYHSLSKALPDAFGGGEAIRKGIANKAVSQTVPRAAPNRPSGLVGVGVQAQQARDRYPPTQLKPR